MKKRLSFSFLFTAALLWGMTAGGQTASKSHIRLPGLFCNHMVVQQRSDLPVWGWGTPGERITVTTSWDGESRSTQADSLSRWSVTIRTPEAGGPHTITISGRYDIELKNVMSGEVWLCCGQSNMEWAPMSLKEEGIPNREAELSAADRYPQVRYLHVKRADNDTPQEDFEGIWNVSNRASSKWFTAVGQFFGRTLNEKLGVPVGLIGSYWGGTGAEVWTPAPVVEADPELAEAASRQHGDPRWYWPVRPGRAYNSMIHPLMRFPIAGVIWYQGESNAATYATYEKLLQRMVASWREGWKSEFPFYIVQISPYKDKEGMPGSNVLLREQQDRASRSIPRSGLVVVSDAGDSTTIHPTDKRPVGERLAWLACADHYGADSCREWLCPRYESFSVRDNRMTLIFSRTGGELRTASGEPSRYFEVAGKDMEFHPARAELHGDRVVLSSPEVLHPTAARYGWGSLQYPDLVNRNGLPLGAFRTYR